MIFQSSYFDLVRPIPGSVEGVGVVARQHELAIITARPISLTTQTHDWLGKYFPGEFSSVYLTNQASIDGPRRTKSEVCLEIGAGILIEDTLENAEECASKGIDVLLYERPWNRDVVGLHERITRVRSWKEVVDYLCS